MGSNTKGGQIGTNSPELEAYIKKGAHSVNAWLSSYTLLLVGAGVTRVRIEYSGSGDSGQVDDISFYAGDKDVSDPFGSDAITKRFESFIYDVLDHRGWDYNNDGCQGNMEWSLGDDTFTHHHEENVMGTNDTDHEEADDLIAALDPDNPEA